MDLKIVFIHIIFTFFLLVENESHCDFVKLREMLIRTNMEDMREKTHTRHYELYRQKRLEQMGFTDVDSDNKPVSVVNVHNLQFPTLILIPKTMRTE